MTPKAAQKTQSTQPVRAEKRIRRTKLRTAGKGICEVTVSDGGVRLRVFKIGETRDNLPQMVNCLQTGATSSYIVGPYGKPSIALVSYERFRPLLTDGTKEERFAFLIADELLPDAPQHLWTSAIEELCVLPKSDLLLIWRLTGASSDDEISAIRGQLKHPVVLDRLQIRMRVAKAITEARDAGLYDVTEDMASTVLKGRE